MKAIRLSEHITAQFDDQGEWHCEHAGIAQGLNVMTRIIRMQMSPAHGHPRTFIVSEIAKRMNAQVVYRGEPGAFDPNVAY